jgi:hypothetical protein
MCLSRRCKMPDATRSRDRSRRRQPEPPRSRRLTRRVNRSACSEFSEVPDMGWCVPVVHAVRSTDLLTAKEIVRE